MFKGPAMTDDAQCMTTAIGHLGDSDDLSLSLKKCSFKGLPPSNLEPIIACL